MILEITSSKQTLPVQARPQVDTNPPSVSMELAPHKRLVSCVVSLDWTCLRGQNISREMAHFLEAANLKDMQAGIVATSRVTHATPAAYAVQVKDRALDNAITDVDVLFGVGRTREVDKFSYHVLDCKRRS